MADKKKQVKIRETKESVFNALKNLAPSLFGSKVWADVAFFGDDPQDTSKFIVIFDEETE